MEQMLLRDNRVYDSTLASHIARSPNFFAQTSLIILGGLLAVVGSGDQVLGLVAEVPFARRNDSLTWNAKLGVEILVFIYAFFKFTWSMRQFNYLMILMGAAPPPFSETLAAAAHPGTRTYSAKPAGAPATVMSSESPKGYSVSTVTVTPR